MIPVSFASGFACKSVQFWTASNNYTSLTTLSSRRN